MPLLDFQFMRSVVHLCPTCTLLIRHIAVANERRGNGAMVDFFVGVPGSVLILKDSYRLRLACTSSGTHLYSLSCACRTHGMPTPQLVCYCNIRHAYPTRITDTHN
jgi:hypothetical protein